MQPPKTFSSGVANQVTASRGLTNEQPVARLKNLDVRVNDVMEERDFTVMLQRDYGEFRGRGVAVTFEQESGGGEKPIAVVVAGVGETEVRVGNDEQPLL